METNKIKRGFFSWAYVWYWGVGTTQPSVCWWAYHIIWSPILLIFSFKVNREEKVPSLIEKRYREEDQKKHENKHNPFSSNFQSMVGANWL